MISPILCLESISKNFGQVKVLRDINLEINAGEIHALAGENGAGKSTLMNIIGGIYKPTSGQIILKGKPVVINSPLEAQDKGISLVHQEIALCPDVTVGENVMMAQMARSSNLFVKYADIHNQAHEMLENLTDISSKEILGNLSISKQQLVEICRALNTECEILILDEPTAALTQSEADALFVILQGLRDIGMAIIYISHRMSEIYELCDKITVLRDGRLISTDLISDVTPDEVVHRLVGQKFDALYPDKSDRIGDDVLLKADELSDGEMVNGISLELKRGEILGVAGLIGSGRTELLELICGLRERENGQVLLEGGKDFSPESYFSAIKEGVVCLSEDRKVNGVFLDLSIARNISSLDLSQVVTPLGLVSQPLEMAQADRLSKKLNIKCANLHQKVSELSGGNQQKVAIAKLLSVKPKIVLLDEPTRGIDVGAKAEIHGLLRNLADSGVGVLIVSSELNEIIGLCDRVLVLSEGQLSGILSGGQLNEGELVKLAAGIANPSKIKEIQYG